MNIPSTQLLLRLFPPGKERALVVPALMSLVAFTTFRLLLPVELAPNGLDELRASRVMQSAVEVLRQQYVARGLEFDAALDPNRTGLIGPEYTEMVTTLGSIEAKRTTTNPNIAGAIVRMMGEAGVHRGDTIAVGCSGSFPALAVATLSAAVALGVHPVVVISLGSSSFGANRIEWTLLDILAEVNRQGVIAFQPSAVSLGGADDVGYELEPEVKAQLLKKIQSSGLPFLDEPNLEKNVAERMKIYEGPSRSGRLAAFVNIGGNHADLGTDPAILKLDPGVNTTIALPKNEKKYGVVFAMAKRHIPVVHLLHIKGLAVKYGLPWDPVPLPQVTDAGPMQRRVALSSPSGVVAITYFALIILTFILFRKAFVRILS